ncbi:MAG TPA: response regulator, partial [Anaerolineae bacterium]
MAVSNLALVIEDDEKLAGIYAKMLETLNFETEIIQDGAPTLIWLAKTVPDLVVLDLHLPHVAGQDILKQIQFDDRLARTRVIIITADVAL